MKGDKISYWELFDSFVSVSVVYGVVVVVVVFGYLLVM